MLRGAAYDLLGQPQANMGIAMGDVDENGLMDLLVTHFGGEMNALYLQQAGGEFVESAGPRGLGESDIPYTKWGAAFFDVEHDGDLDLAIVNGRVKRAETWPVPGAGTPPSTSGAWETYAEPGQLFINVGKAHFKPQANVVEPFCNTRGVSRALAVGDIDNDGDLDLLATTVAGPARLYRNVAEKRGHWLQVRAVEPKLGGRDAYGALVSVSAAGRRWDRLINPAYSFLASSDPRAHFGLGEVTAIDRISVVWGDGAEEIFPGGDVDRCLVIRRGEGSAP